MPKKLLIVCLILLVINLGLAGWFFLMRKNVVSTDNKKTTGLVDKQEDLLKESNSQKKSQVEKFSLMFVGDMMLSRGVDSQMRRKDNWAWSFLKIKDYLQEADLLFGNLEGMISDKGADRGKKYSFQANPKAMKGLKLAGFDVVSVANNHALDWGTKSFKDGVERLERANIKPVGFGRQSIIELSDGTKIGFLGYNLVGKNLRELLGKERIDLEKIEEDIMRLDSPVKPGNDKRGPGNDKGISGNGKRKVDLIVVSFHWGEEYEHHPNQEQKRIAHAAIEAGADLVIGHHPHVRQDTEWFKGKPIFYSLGNFIFDQNFSLETRQGYLAKVIIQNGKIKSAQPVKIRISKEYQPSLEEKINLGQWDENSLNDLVKKYRDQTISQRIVSISQHFLDIPYKANTLIGSPSQEEKFVVNLEGLDCFTFLDYVLALSLTQDVDDFYEKLKQVRYQDGQISFSKRNHYFTQWIEHNKKYLFDVGKDSSKSKCIVKRLNKVEGLPAFKQEVCFFENNFQSVLKQGDLVGFYTKEEGLDVTHVGLIFKKSGQWFLRHASSRQGKVVEEPLDKRALVILRLSY